MNRSPTDSYQQAFFAKLEPRFDKRSDMVCALSEALHVGRDAIYRRLRGETLLSADELILLARKYLVKLDEFENSSAQLIYPAAFENITAELQYYQELEEKCMFIAALPEVKVDYATPELPIYYDLFTPTLLAFKTFVYGLTTWNLEKWKGKVFHPKLIDPEIFNVAERLLELLYKLPGRELWSIGILDVTLRQIEHAVEVGRLTDPGLIDLLFQELEFIISHMEAMTKSGKRFVPGKMPTERDPEFCVFHNEMTNTNNVIIVNSPNFSTVFSTFINPNFIISVDERIQTKLEIWFDNLVDNSNVLDATSGKYVEKFFTRLRRVVALSRQRIDVELSVIS